MSSSALGIGYSMWLHLRWVAIGVAIYLAVVATAVQVVPSPMYVGLFGTLALSSVIAHMLTAFTLGPSDLGARGSGYPKNMLVLPLRTRSLVGWPMLFGATAIALLWIFVSACILRPSGLETPVLWPAALGAAGTAWLQAVSWSPFPSPFARIPALALAALPIILFGSCAGLYMESQMVSWAITAASLVWALVAFVFAIQGLSRARAGSEGQWLHDFLGRRVARIRARRVSDGRVLPRFRTPFTAHLWYECRRNAFVLPMIFAFAGCPFMFATLRSVIAEDANELFLFGSAQLSPSLLGLALMVGGLIMFCGLYGPGMGKFDVWGKDPIPPFFAIRPVTTPRFVLIKMAAAAISVLIAYVMLFAIVALWALAETSSWNPRDSVVRATFSNAAPRTIALAILAPIAVYALSCREMLTAMWSALTGRKWVPIGFGIAMMILLAVGGTIGFWIYRRPQYHSQVIAWAPWLVGLLLVVRFGIAAWIFQAIGKLQLVPPRTMQRWLAAWAAGCVILFLLLWCFVTPTFTMAAMVLFLVPLARLAAAPLALHYNRHR
jgi:hypothetical protein